MSAFRIIRRLRELLDVDTSGAAPGDALVLDVDGETWVPGAGGGGGVTDADYLVGTANAGLSAEIVVGTTPGGELGGTWGSPTVDVTHSGSSHAAIQAAAEATAAAALAAHAGASDPHPTYTTAAELAAYAQPLDSDLTAIAALSTTAFGRSLLALADAAALLAAAGAAAASHVHAGEDITSGTVADARIASTIARDSEVTSAISALSSVYQPLDSDLTAIAALTTTSFGRGLLAEASASSLRTTLSLVPGTDVEVHDADLTTIAGLSPSNDDVLQRKAGAWTNRTLAQLASDLGTGSGETVSKAISQTGHGLSVANAVRYSGTAYVKAQADSAANAEVVGIVSAVADADHFTLVVGGRVTGLSGLTAGTVYFLDDDTAGLLTATEPPDLGDISKPLLVADSTTSGWLVNYRGSVNGAGAASSDGWIDDSAATWTRTADTTFTVSGDRTAVFSKGTRLRWTQTTVKYGVVIASSHSSGTTTVTIATTTDYVLAAAAISANSYSYEANPQGYPGYFNYTPTWTGYSSPPSGGSNRFCVIGRTCHVVVSPGSDGTSNATTKSVTIPIPASASSADVYGAGFAKDNGANQTTSGLVLITASATAAGLYINMAAALWTGSGSARSIFQVWYEI